MGFFEAFFDTAHAATPYAAEQEALGDVLAFTDLILNIAAWGRDEIQERLDMRGVVITPQEFRMALEERMRKVPGSEAEEVRQFRNQSHREIRLAWEQLAGRMQKSREAGKEPRIGALVRRGALNPGETLCLYLAAAVELDRKYERIYGYLQDNVTAKLPTVGLGISLASMLERAFAGEGDTGIERNSIWHWCIPKPDSPLWNLFLERASGEEAASRLSCPMRLKTSVWEYLMGIRAEAEFWDTAGQEAEKDKDSIGGCAFRVRLGYQWEDLILEESQKDLLRHICDRVTYQKTVVEDWGFGQKSFYGNGISTVFYGSPGTGKTMAAQVLAGELGMELYKIDLSRLVSKYIGETEKNLGEVFDAARRRNIILFFDEADALFARRSEVTGSNDRYANMETGYLLQKLEEYDGIAILATNFINNLDEAFKRRIRFFVRFPFPDPDMRLKLWNQMIPPQAKVEEELELARYARQFELTGSDIKEIVTSSAYLAAAKGRGICRKDLVEAMQIYYRKIGKRLTAEELTGGRNIL